MLEDTTRKKDFPHPTSNFQHPASNFHLINYEHNNKKQKMVR
jgi:hypothetical protein